MRRMFLAAAALAATTSLAQAVEVVFWGGLSVTSTANCDTGWNPDKQLFVGTWFVPVPGSTNGTDSTLVFHNRGQGGEAFSLFDDVFTGTYKTAEATHIFTRAGGYTARVKATQTPATLDMTTNIVRVTGAVRGWDRDIDCTVNFLFSGVKRLD